MFKEPQSKKTFFPDWGETANISVSSQGKSMENILNIYSVLDTG